MAGALRRASLLTLETDSTLRSLKRSEPPWRKRRPLRPFEAEGGSQEELTGMLSDSPAEVYVLPVANAHFNVNSVLGCEIVTLRCLLAKDSQALSQ